MSLSVSFEQASDFTTRAGGKRYGGLPPQQSDAPLQPREEAGPDYEALVEQVIARTRRESSLPDELFRSGEMLLADILHIGSSGIFSWHVATDDIVFSQELHRLFALDPTRAVTSERVSALVHPEDSRSWHAALEQARRHGTDLDLSFRLQMPDLALKYLRILARSNGCGGSHLAYIGMIQDATSSRLAEDMLRTARAEILHLSRVATLGTLTASIAHEVAQPISAIITNANTLLRMLSTDVPSIEGAREVAQRTLRDAQRAANVITRLRALFSKTNITSESIDLNAIVEEVVALTHHDLQRGHVLVQFELAEGLPPVSGDRVQLQQVILNLLLNAAEAMAGVDERRRKLVIRTCVTEGQQVRFSMRDSGTGLNSRDTPRIFEPFITTKRHGMGLGLSVSRAIIESHRGRLWALANDRRGATFLFQLPAEAGAKCAGTIAKSRGPERQHA